MKEAKAEAHYQDRPNKTRHCARCRNFVAPQSCTKVAGKISPQGWCEYFAAKGAKVQAEME